MKDSLAERLRQARRNAKLSQSELARLVEISPQAIQHIEAGKTLRTRYITKIAAVLNVSTDWLENGIKNEAEEGYFAVPAQQRVFPGTRLKMPTDPLNQFLEANPEGRSNPKHAAFQKDRIPVFVSMPLATALPERDRDLELITLMDCTELILPDDADAEDTADFLANTFNRFIETDASSGFPRPHYLADSEDGYGLATLFLKTMHPILGRWETAHVNPGKPLELGQNVFIWTKTNSFIVGSIEDITPEIIDISFFGKYDMHLLRISIKAIKAIHTLVGIEYEIPDKTTKFINSHFEKLYGVGAPRRRGSTTRPPHK